MFIFQSETQPNTILNALRDIFSPGMASVKICSSYVSLEGSRLLYSELSSAADPEQISIELICALDFGITQPEAIEYWMERATVYIAGHELLQTGSLLPNSSAFHPKFYIAQGKPGEGAVAIVGSANLTTRGLSVNSEAAMRVEDATDEQCFSTIWESAEKQAVRATKDLVGRYRQLHQKRTPSPTEREHEPPPPPPVGTHNGPFSEAGLNLQTFPVFWLQTTGMSGGGGTQMEIPRGGHKFFTGAKEPDLDIDTAEDLKQLKLTIRGRDFTDPKLTWHGDNRMERLNVPNPTRCGVNWGNSLVVIRRQAHDHYTLRAYAWDSVPAKAIKRASERLGLLFKVGKGHTNRLCGLLPDLD